MTRPNEHAINLEAILDRQDARDHGIKDRDGRCLLAHQSFADLTGMRKEKLIGFKVVRMAHLDDDRRVIAEGVPIG